ncbi:hypothetical protein JYU19_02045 [bacterium AH-315-J21]|nr:hypothetical protein [bacterium AH-315-J21]
MISKVTLRGLSAKNQSLKYESDSKKRASPLKAVAFGEEAQRLVIID